MDENNKIKVVDKVKAIEILGCSQASFYIKYYPALSKFSFKGKDKRKPLYPLYKVEALKNEDALSGKYEIVK